MNFLLNRLNLLWGRNVAWSGERCSQSRSLLTLGVELSLVRALGCLGTLLGGSFRSFGLSLGSFCGWFWNGGLLFLWLWRRFLACRRSELRRDDSRIDRGSLDRSLSGWRSSCRWCIFVRTLAGQRWKIRTLDTTVSVELLAGSGQMRQLVTYLSSSS